MNQKKNLQILDQFWLRVIAMISMTIAHIGTFIGLYANEIGSNAANVAHIFYILGRFAFPLFVFMMVEGMFYTSNRLKYLGRIAIVYAILMIAEIIFVYGMAKNPDLANGDYPGPNPFTDLILIALALFFLSLPGWKKIFAILPIGVTILSYVLLMIETRNASTIYWFPLMYRPGYGIYGMAMALGFYAVRPVASLMGKKYCTTLSIDYESYLQTPEYQKLMNLLSSTVLCTVTLIFWGISYLTYDPYRMPLQTYCLLSMPLLYLYSGKRGYDSKAFRIFTYAYFPVHLGILILIFFVSFGHL